jgi:hypothetical protein
VQRILGVALLIGAVSVSLSAATLSGQFTLVGTVTVTNAGLIEWTSNASVSNEATISSSSTLSGSFAGLGNQVVDINTLTDGPDPATDQPLNTPFTNFNFIDFPGDPGFPELLANFMPLGSATGANCSTNVALAAANQTCTLNAATNPAINGGSPFTFLNTETSANQVPVCCTSSATWNISGVTSDGQSLWNGQFNATFPFPYQQVLSNFANNGQVSDAYSGVMVVSIEQIQTIPEPTTLALMGTGLVLLWVGTRRRRRTKA